MWVENDEILFETRYSDILLERRFEVDSGDIELLADLLIELVDKFHTDKYIEAYNKRHNITHAHLSTLTNAMNTGVLN